MSLRPTSADTAQQRRTARTALRPPAGSAEGHPAARLLPDPGEYSACSSSFSAAVSSASPSCRSSGCCAAHVLHGTRIQPLQNRQHLMPQYVPGSIILPGWWNPPHRARCVPRRKPPSPPGSLPERGAESRPAPPGIPARPLQSRAPQEIQQHGFRIVIGVMRRAESRRSPAAPSPGQKRIPQLPGRPPPGTAPPRAARARTSPLSGRQRGCPERRHQSRTKASSRSASAPRSWWLKWAAMGAKPVLHAPRRSSRCSRHMESSPPDTAAQHRPPRRHAAPCRQKRSGGIQLIRPRHTGSPAWQKVVYSGIHRSSTLPVSPWRFLATMHSAMLRFSESSL